jgi:heme-binding protein
MRRCCTLTEGPLHNLFAIRKNLDEGTTAMRSSATCLWRILVGAVVLCVVGAVATVATTSSTAGAAPAPCTASGLAATASGVLSAAGGYLDSHPDANDVLTAAVSQSPAEARSSVRGYFVAHPNEFLDLQNIARPLTDLRSQCNTSVSPAQLAALFDALSG